MPGLVTGRALEARGFSVRYFGEGKPIEEDLMRAQGVELIRPGEGGRLRRFCGLWRRLLQEERKGRPGAVLLFGGFSSLALGLHARLRRIPAFIFEQNAVPGRVNRLLAAGAKKVLLTYGCARERLPSSADCVVTGNPVRLAPEAREREYDVLVLGGSQGAGALNCVLPGVLPQGLKILHLSGPGRSQEASAAYGDRAGVRVLEQHPEVMALVAASRWVVTRAGATTLAELAAVGAAAIAVPYPHARDDHQRRNAGELAAPGALLVIEEGELPAAAERLEKWLQDGDLAYRLGRKLKDSGLADPGALRALAVLEACAVLPGKGGAGFNPS